MSHYNISYKGLKKAQARAQALKDIADWLGSPSRFREVTALIQKEQSITQRQFIFYASMTGVQGYPVIAWWEHCFPSRKWQNEDEEDDRSIINPDKENPL